jgi:hypothetical protein
MDHHIPPQPRGGTGGYGLIVSSRTAAFIAGGTSDRITLIAALGFSSPTHESPLDATCRRLAGVYVLTILADLYDEKRYH